MVSFPPKGQAVLIVHADAVAAALISLGLAREERFELLPARALLGEELLLLVELGALRPPLRRRPELYRGWL
jgi:hypothetical protein